MDKVITDFLATNFYKKEFEKWNKALIKVVKNNDKEKERIAINELSTIRHKANTKLNDWLNSSSKIAGQLSLTTHPPKFSHPDAKIDVIIANCNQENDGLLRSGNVEIDLDVVGNAASLRVNKFLHLVLGNNLTILQNLEQNTDYINQQFKINNFNKVKTNFLKIKKSGKTTKSSDKLKQIYFPIDDDYHLLSLLTPSAIIYKLKQRINDNFQAFSLNNKKAKEQVEKALKNGDEFDGILENIWGLTAFGYGGTKPQNISVINSKNGGVSYLLSSAPPILKKRKVQPPKQDFFETHIYLDDWLKQDFSFLNKILSGRNNIKIRNKRDAIIINIMFQIKAKIDKIRSIDKGWSNSDTYTKLPEWQRILLDSQYENIRNDKDKNQDFLNHTQLEFAKWFSKIYNKLYDTNLGDIDITHIESVIEGEVEVFK
ncbi:CRISPR-associated protein, Csy1 family [uncultured Gammaproteobacteria bacterium]|jgi:CRISPR-associated protein Csy1|nr:CRISPR-associated protein, Csy1 family [uncultured Gammaproteobacteria bacterium]CAC9587262.1 CRISPR-associated protein, Csy1 family [uncultured Gammaproteobacteria bacterium]CAC9587886.1 CRISPR-associated protein, Csy1 family [uncultured Gammaproteobacteria bacterium]CAC9953096.1 CRISPR-associated protein, Csy1 family [uncultured Gammaproteobacteria bacterium]